MPNNYIEDIISNMAHNIKDLDSSNRTSKQWFITLLDEDDEYKNLVSPILEVIDNKDDKWIKELQDYISDGVGFDKKFEEFCDAYSEAFSQKRKFLCLIDVDEFMNKIKNSNTKGIYNVITGIRDVYDFSNLYDYYLDDINTIKNILSRLNENSLSKSKTKSIAIEQLKQMLEEKLAILNREN